MTLSVQPFDPAAIDHLRAQSYGQLRLFAPYDDTHGAFLALLRSAQSSISISIYGYTLPDATDVLIAKHQAGVKVLVLFDHTQAQGMAERAQIKRLRKAGVEHWIGTSPDAHQILHAKVCVVDDVLTESGSWNYSVSAAHQANTFLLEASSDVARVFSGFIQRCCEWVRTHEPRYQDAPTGQS